MKKIIGLALFAFLLIGSVALKPIQPTPINRCQAIMESGNYILTRDLHPLFISSQKNYCLRILADDVFLDGAQHTIGGVYVSASDVELTNAKIVEANYGIHIEYSEGVVLRSIKIKSIRKSAVYARESSNLEILNSDFKGFGQDTSSVSAGVKLFRVTNAEISNNSFSDSSKRTIDALIGENIVIERNVAMGTGSFVNVGLFEGDITVRYNQGRDSMGNGVRVEECHNANAIIDGNSFVNYARIGIDLVDSDGSFLVQNNYIENVSSFWCDHRHKLFALGSLGIENAVWRNNVVKDMHCIGFRITDTRDTLIQNMDVRGAEDLDLELTYYSTIQADNFLFDDYYVDSTSEIIWLNGGVIN